VTSILSASASQLGALPALALDLETTGLNFARDRIVQQQSDSLKGYSRHIKTNLEI